MQIDALCNRLALSLIPGRRADRFLTNSTEVTSGETTDYLRVVTTSAKGGSGYTANYLRVVTKTMRVMQLTAILLTVCCLSVTAKTVSQSVTYKGKNVKLETVFTVIEKQTGFFVLFEEEVLSNAKLVSVTARDMPLAEFMDKILEGQPFEYSLENTTISIKPKSTVAAVSPRLDIPAAPPITGIVTNADRQPLVGASVKIKGTNTGVTTDANGRFTIDAENGQVLIISYVGFTNQEINVKEGNIYVKLNSSNNPLDEVVFKGYYSEKRRITTGNVSAVGAKEIEKQPVGNVLAASAGRMPGVIINQTSGVAGSDFTIQIRGQNSLRRGGIFANGNLPLYVIDGVPFSSSPLNGNVLSAAGNLSPLNNLNPGDIEKIEVLKDADATSIWGSRGANGVVLITTKKGKAGKTAVDINAYTGAGKITRTMSLMNTEQYLEMRKEAFTNDAATTQSWDYDLNEWSQTRNTDWKKVLIGGTAKTTSIRAAVSGGSELTQFLLSGSYYKEGTVFPGDFNDEKISTHFTLNNSSVNRKFKTALNATFNIDNNNLLRDDLTGFAMRLVPNAPELYDSAGKLNWENSTWENPLAKTERKYNGNTKNFIGSISLQYELITGLFLKTNMSYNTMIMKELYKFPQSGDNPAFSSFFQRTSNFTDYNINTWITEPQVTYEHILGPGKLSVLAGASFQQTKREGSALEVKGYSSDALMDNPMAGPISNITGASYSRYAYSSVLGRINYNIDDKYIVNLSGRRDGSSRFGPGKRFANFGAVGAAWIFSKENFIADQFHFLSFGKLRGSYGSTGNDQIGDYNYLSLYSNTLPYQGIAGLTPDGLFNENYRWETIRKLEFGLDLGFLNDKLLFNASYYRNRSANQLVGLTLPTLTGFNNVIANMPAVVQNTGFEFMLSANLGKAKGLTWSAALNLTLPGSKLVAYPDLESSVFRLDYLLDEPLSIIRTYQFAGVDPQTGLYNYYNAAGEKTDFPSSTKDRTGFVNINPKYYGGLQNTFEFAGFQLDIFFQFVKQTGRNYLWANNTPPGGLSNQPTIVLDRWRKPGDITNIQKFTQDFQRYTTYANAFESGYASNIYGDASFIRLKNLSFSYQLKNLIKNASLSSCRIFIQGQNMLTITNYQGHDPETQSYFTLPPLKMLTAGIQITL